jgi:uncharacterized protein
MLTTRELTQIAERKHLTIRNAEKDYLLELILFSLSDIRRELVFKGGTALYKFYNLNRFSEDLDFDVVDQRLDIEKLITRVLRSLELIGMKRTLHEIASHGNETNIRLVIRGPLYDGSKPSMSRISINLSRREQPQTMHDRLLTASYPNIPSFEVNVLDEREIAAEKVGCIMTREKPRDVYDLWFLSKRGVSLDLMIIQRKLRIYQLHFTQAMFSRKIQEKRLMWSRDLGSLIIGTLPPFQTIAADLETWSLTWK